jgi:hypothetical protein
MNTRINNNYFNLLKTKNILQQIILQSFDHHVLVVLDNFLDN